MAATWSISTLDRQLVDGEHTEWTTKLMNDDSFTDPIPSNQADFVTLVTSRDDYQTRTERDAVETN